MGLIPFNAHFFPSLCNNGKGSIETRQREREGMGRTSLLPFLPSFHNPEALADVFAWGDKCISIFSRRWTCFHEDTNISHHALHLSSKRTFAMLWLPQMLTCICLHLALATWNLQTYYKMYVLPSLEGVHLQFLAGIAFVFSAGIALDNCFKMK